MKFGKEYEETLAKGGFPAEWVYSAISYRQLKKCIKKVREELLELGLDADTLGQLLQAFNDEEDQGARRNSGQPFEYRFSSESQSKGSSTRSFGQGSGSPEIFQGFRPKLLFAVDEETGEPVDAFLSPDTKQYLHHLAVTQQLTDVRITELSSSNSSIKDAYPSSQDGEVRGTIPRTRMIEVPLTSDGVFFKRLRAELSGLEQMQAEEKEKLSAKVKGMGKLLCKSTEPARALSTHKSDLSVWREIFKLYMDYEIFFSTQELDHGARRSNQVHNRLEEFFDQLKKRNLEAKLKRKDSKTALNQFLALNVDLFKNLRFQEIEYKAMTKILKSECQYSVLVTATDHIRI